MRAWEFEQFAKQAALKTKHRLETLFLKQRLDRCRKGLPVNPQWEAKWKAYIQKQTLAALASGVPLTINKKQNKSPTALQKSQPATRIAEMAPKRCSGR